MNEKKIAEKERQVEERRLDTIMEIERLKAIKMYDEREKRRALDNKLGAQVLLSCPNLCCFIGSNRYLSPPGHRGADHGP